MSKELTPEEIARLEQIATSESAPNEDTELTEAERFVIALGVKAGDTKVLPIQIWDTYKKWAKGDRIYYDVFFKQFAKLFKREKWGHFGVFYSLDPTPFDLTEGTYWKLRANLRKAREYKRREKVKKANKEKQD